MTQADDVSVQKVFIYKGSKKNESQFIEDKN